MALLPYRAVAALVALAGVCVSCGGSSGSPRTQPSPSTTPTPVVSPSSSPSVAAQKPVPAESNPPGDIPDNLAFVAFSSATGHYRFVHPEGWAQVVHGTDVRFTDKLNGVIATVVSASQAPTVASAKRDDVPRLQSSVPAFELRSVSAVTVAGGSAVLIVFRRNSDPDPVTGRQYRDEVREFLFWRGGREVRFDLFGPVGADNVDAYRTMSNSVRLS